MNKFILYLFILAFIVNSCGQDENKLPINKNKNLSLSVKNTKTQSDGIIVNLEFINNSNSDIFMFYSTCGDVCDNYLLLLKTENGTIIEFKNDKAIYNGKNLDNVLKIAPKQNYPIKSFLSTQAILMDSYKIELIRINETQELGQLFVGDKLLNFVEIKVKFNNNIDSFYSGNFGIVKMWTGEIETDWIKINKP